MPSLNEISVASLSRLIGTVDAPVLIDLCIDEDFALDPRLIPGAFRFPFTDIVSLAPRLKERGSRVVLYCQKGKKISQGAAALLRSHGVATEILSGGQFAWRDAGQPLVPAAKIPKPENSEHSLWVTRHRPKVDRVACPWLIRRFVDPGAVFMFVAPATVLDVADRFDATPFDMEGVFWSHRKERCTFDTMIEEFELNVEALHELAVIVRGADTDRLDLAPQSAGLLASSLGLSRMYRDDLQQLDAAMLLYDSFYRWVRDAADESHDWPGPGARPKT